MEREGKLGDCIICAETASCRNCFVSYTIYALFAHHESMIELLFTKSGFPDGSMNYLAGCFGFSRLRSRFEWWGPEE